MPEGYKCDRCGDFNRYTHNATRIDFQQVVYDSGEEGATEKILCPECGQDVWEFVTGQEAPREALDAHGYEVR